MLSSKQHSALFWHCKVSERIRSATTVALTVVEKRCRRLAAVQGCVFYLIKYISIFLITTIFLSSPLTKGEDVCLQTDEGCVFYTLL